MRFGQEDRSKVRSFFIRTFLLRLFRGAHFEHSSSHYSSEFKPLQNRSELGNLACSWRGRTVQFKQLKMFFGFFTLQFLPHRWRGQYQLISCYIEETLDHANYRVRLHFSYHLMPRERKIHLNIAHCFCRRRESNPGRLLSKRVLYPLRHCLLATTDGCISCVASNSH